jgi:L-amino acid N-acyltransferase YncA
LSNNPVVRRAVESDVGEITRIYNDAILNTTATFDMEPKTLDDRLDWFRDRTDDYPVIVATVEGKVAGWAEIKPFGTRRAYRYTVENAVYVDLECQGKGIGSALLGELVEIASDKGFHVILALIVAGNECSVRLHARLGFEQVGVMREVGRKFDRWLDLLVFEKTLSS